MRDRELSQGQMIRMLKDHGISITQQRLMVLKCLLNTPGHPDAEAVYARVTDMDQVISKATVYNTLNLFERKGMISSLDIDGHTLHFDKIIEPHGHFLCQSCGEIYNFTLPAASLEVALDGFLVTKRDVYFKGICPACQNNDKRADDRAIDADKNDWKEEETE